MRFSSTVMPVLLPLVLALAGATAPAVEPAPSFIAAIDHAPAVAAARAQARAAAADSAAAGTLPDPELSANPERNPEMARRRFGVTHTEVLLSQSLPRWGERDAQRQLAASACGEAEAELALTRGEMAAAVAASLADRAAALGRMQLARDTAARIETAIVQLTAALASSPTASAQPLWALRSRGETAALALHAAERDRDDAEAAVRSLLGLSATAALPDPLLPEPAEAGYPVSPGVLLAKARAQGARAGESAAGARRRPTVALAVGWEGSRDDNAYEAMVTVSLPIHLDAYAAGEEAARARSAAAEALERRERFAAERLAATAKRAMAHADEERALAERSRERDAAAAAAALAAVGTRDGLPALLEALDRLAERGQSLIEAEAASARARAELWRLAPPYPADPSTSGPARSQP